jgi:hypothetical protein
MSKHGIHSSDLSVHVVCWVTLASIMCAFRGPAVRTLRAMKKKSCSSELLLSSVSLNLIYSDFLWTPLGARTDSCLSVVRLQNGMFCYLWYCDVEM